MWLQHYKNMIAIPSTSSVSNCNDDDNLTSILYQLENKCFVEESINFKDVERHIDEFIQFLNSTVLRIVLNGRTEDTFKCYNKISEIQTVLSMIEYQTKKLNGIYSYQLHCGLCGEKVTKDRKEHFWNDLQEHEHIEKLWASYLMGGFEAMGSEIEKEVPSVTKSVNRVPCMQYDRSVLNFCYPKEFIRQLYLVDNVPEYTMQFRGTGTMCLLCKMPATLTGTSLKDHIHGSKHKRNAKDPRAIAMLNAYHLHFSRLPSNYQAHTIYFIPRNLEKIKCRLCKKKVDYDQLEAHILSVQHREECLQRLSKCKYTKYEILLTKACTLYSNVDKVINFASSSYNNVLISKSSNNSTLVTTSDDDESNNFVIKFSTSENEITNRSNLKEEEEDKPAEFKFNFIISDENETVSQQPTLEDLCYDPLVLENAYPEHITSLSYQIDNVPYYTIQMKSVADAYCLLCACIIEGRLHSIKVHLNGSRHQQNSAIGKKFFDLKSYHIAFMRLSFELQPHLIYFCPYSTKRTTCGLCKQYVKYDSLEHHILGSMHKDIIMKRYGNGNYEKKEVLLKRAARIFLTERGEKSDESESNNTDSPTRNEANESINSAAQMKVVHDIVRSITNPESVSFLERLENRFRSHLNLLEERKNEIYCKCCNIAIEKVRYDVKKHILSQTHKEKAGVANKKYKYICDVCTAIYSKELSWQEHLQKEEHHKRCSEVSPTKKNNLSEFECRTCNIIVFGDTFSAKKHQKFIRGKNKIAKVITLNENVKMLFKSEKQINAFATQFVLNANSVVENQDNVWNCCRAIEIALSKIYKNCRAYPFGSRVSGLGDQNSDLDVFVDIGDMYMGQKKQDAKSQEKIVKDANKVFREFPGKVFTHVNPVPTARTPIVQVFHTVTQLDCDLSFRHGLSVENTKFLRMCINLQPMTQHLVLMLKHWSHYSKLNEHISTYALSMMAIFYLQTRGLLLSVKQLKELNPEISPIIDGWDTINYSLDCDSMREHIETYTGTLKQLLTNFFKYYSEFKYNTDVICPLLGCVVQKSSFTGSITGDLLPREMHSYIVKLRTDEEPERFRALSPLCIQDPFDLSHNLTKACSAHAVTKLKILCDLSAKYLDSVK